MTHLNSVIGRKGKYTSKITGVVTIITIKDVICTLDEGTTDLYYLSKNNVQYPIKDIIILAEKIIGIIGKAQSLAQSLTESLAKESNKDIVITGTNIFKNKTIMTIQESIEKDSYIQIEALPQYDDLQFFEKKGSKFHK